MSRKTAPEVRFERHVDRSEGGCWLWTGGLTSGGYGSFHDGQRHRQAHAWAYETFVRPVPLGLILDHICHTLDTNCPGGKCSHRRCVNPHHLEPVTAQQNVLRGRGLAAVNAAKTHCINGHELTPENTRIGMDRGKPRRVCRACHAALARRIRAAAS